MAKSLLVADPLIILATIAMASVSLVGSLFDSRGRFQQACSRAWSRAVLYLSGIRLEVRGLHHIQPRGRYVFCANHQSYMDIPSLLVALPFQVRFAAKKELFGVPFLGWHLRRAGHFPVDRANPLAAMRSLGRSVERILEGEPVIFFPEGTMSRDGSIARFKGGAVAIAARCGADLVPVTIRGTRSVLPPGSVHIRPGKVEIQIDPPVRCDSGSPTEVLDHVRGIILRRFGGAPEARP